MISIFKSLSKKTFGFMVMLTIMVSVWSCKSAPVVVGTLTAYYAKEDFDEYQQGQLVFDSNNPYFELKDLDAESYQLEGILSNGEFVKKIPKSKIEVKTYTMTELPVSEVEEGASFKSERGRVAKIFMSDINGHKYFADDIGLEEDAQETANNVKCYVLSAELYADQQDRFWFEEQLPETDGFLKLYDDYLDLTDLGAPANYKKEEGKSGYLQETWINAADWDEDRSAYDKDGKLQVDQRLAGRLPNYISIAYIADLDALYIDGQLYSRDQNDSNQPDYAALVREHLPSVGAFVSTVNVFQKGTKQYLPTGQVWDNAETEIGSVLGSKDFSIERDKDRVFFISATKNCKFKSDEVDYVYSYSIIPNNKDDIAAAFYFEPMGDFYVKGAILFDNINVYDAYVNQIIEFGYKQTREDMEKSDPKEKYSKGNYYFLCDKNKKTIELHYDFMKAQNFG